MPRQETDELLPLKPNWFHVLLTLAEGPRHGYAIMQEVAERTDGKIRLWPATLYGSIKQMVKTGLIEAAGYRRTSPDEDGDERRRYYEITPFGRRVVAAEAERLRELVGVAYRKKVIKRAEPAR